MIVAILASAADGTLYYYYFFKLRLAFNSNDANITVPCKHFFFVILAARARRREGEA